jgi:hemolysin activation/secretion protein
MFTRALLWILYFSAGLVAANAQSAEVYPFRKILLSKSESAVAAMPDDIGGDARVVADDLPLFQKPAFVSALQPLFGKPITIDLLKEIMQVVGGYGLRNDVVVTAMPLSSQHIVGGVLRFSITFARYNDITFQGNRWFSRKILEERLGIKPGDEIRLSSLEEAVNWVNTNPFRMVKVLLNNAPNDPGKSNLLVGVQEATPYRVAFSADNSGNEISGKLRLGASFQFGNLWGKDHLGSYQFSTSDRPNAVQAHAVDYRIPLASRHFIQFNGNYSWSDVTFAQNLIHAESSNWSADLRYTIPLRSGDSPREVYFGTNFKHGDSTLSFDIGTPTEPDFVPARVTATDSFHVLGGFSSVSRKNKGAWIFAATVFASPGNVTPRNTDNAFQGNFDVDDGVIHTERTGGRARYVYANAIIQRLQPLSFGWDFMSRAFFQVSSTNMIGGQQLSIGGSNTVRGYDEGVMSGDDGFIFNNELLTPRWLKRLPFLKGAPAPLETRFLGFLDVGRVRYHKRFGSDVILGSLASTGFGVRSSLASNFSLSFDYGWQLLHQPRQALQPKAPSLDSRGVIKLVLAF